MNKIKISVEDNIEDFLKGESDIVLMVYADYNKLCRIIIKKNNLIVEDFDYTNYKYKTKVCYNLQRDTLVHYIEDYRLNKLVSRYIDILSFHKAIPKKEHRGSTDLNHLLWMLQRILIDDFPISKRYNWLGYIQGILVDKELINIIHEKDIMENLF